MLRTVLALGALSALAAPALAQEEPGSVYFQIDSCASYQLPGEPVWETACLTHDNWSIFLHSSEHGSAIAYAYNGSERTGFYTPPRTLLFGGYHSTMEWRRTSDGAYATIHRYVSEGPSMDADPNGGPDSGLDERQDHLVITALNPDSFERVACPLYVVDASQIADANDAARILADTFAPGHVCDESEPFVFTDMGEVYATVEAYDMEMEAEQGGADEASTQPPKSRP
ncbi:hypothetical protein ABWI01_05130 [Oceanicaulis alexandrii]|uniref:hypothetical protein n=1 Tax=Oceanicaulis alexandrii TaxID=153233 RepID=UPI0035CF143B